MVHVIQCKLHPVLVHVDGQNIVLLDILGTGLHVLSMWCSITSLARHHGLLVSGVVSQVCLAPWLVGNILASVLCLST